MGAFLCCVVMGSQMLCIMMVLTRYGQQQSPSDLTVGAMLVLFVLALSIALFLAPRILPPLMFHAWWIALAVIFIASAFSGYGNVFLPAGLFVLITSVAFVISPIFLPAALLAIWLANRLRYAHIGLFGLLGALFGGATYQVYALAFPAKSFFSEGQGHPLSTAAFGGAGFVAGMTYRWLEERIMRNQET